MKQIKYKHISEEDFKESTFYIPEEQHNIMKEIVEKIDNIWDEPTINKDGTQLMTFIDLSKDRLSRELLKNRYRIIVEKI